MSKTFSFNGVEIKSVADVFRHNHTLKFDNVIKRKTSLVQLVGRWAANYPHFKSCLRCTLLAASKRGAFTSRKARVTKRKAGFFSKLFCFTLFTLGFFYEVALSLRNVPSEQETAQLFYYKSVSWFQAGRCDLAVEVTRRAIRKFPYHSDIIKLFMFLHRDKVHVQNGVMVLCSTNSSLHIGLAALLLHDNGLNDQCVSLLLSFAKAHPEEAEGIAEIILIHCNRRKEAREAFDIAIKYKSTRALRIKRTLAVPMIPGSTDELAEIRKEIIDELSEINENTQEHDSSAYYDTVLYSAIGIYYIWVDNLYPLVYSGENNRDIMMARARSFLNTFPELSFTAHHTVNKTERPKNKIRFGLFLEFSYADIWKFWGPLIQALPRDIFETILFVPMHLPVWVKRHLVTLCDELVEYPYPEKTKVVTVTKAYGADSFTQSRDIISDAGLDIFYNPLLGQTPLGQYLGYARLARVQIFDGAHMNTTGLPEIDYYLLNEWQFLEEPKNCFSEALVMLDDCNPYFRYAFEDAQNAPPLPLARESLGWPKWAHVYLVMSELNKQHPEMTSLFARLLNEDPEGILVLTNRTSGLVAWSDLLNNLQRLGVKDPQVRVLPAPDGQSQPHPHAFLQTIMHLADNCLYCRRYGGGVSFFQTVAAGAPQIIWPSEETHVGFWGAAVYKQIGMEELLVSNEDEYIAANIRLASDKKYRRRIRWEFARKVKYYYDHLAKYNFFGDVSEFMQAAVARANEGLPPAHWHNGKFDDHLTTGEMAEFRRESHARHGRL